MERAKISVLMPVYNTAPYLYQAVKSVLNQTLRDLELIIVDDGSTDNSLEIIKNFALEDKRIKYFHKENEGLSVTRNFALSKASGEFVYFMDSDDIIVEDALQICYRIATGQGLDIVTFDADSFSESGDFGLKRVKYSRKGEIDGNVRSGIEMLMLLVRKDLFRASACLLFISRKLLQKTHLKFFPGIIHEDELFTPILFINASRVSYVSKALFLRRIREDSIMTRKFSEKNINSYFTVIKELKKHIINSGQSARTVITARIRAIVNSVSYQSGSLPFEIRLMVLSRFFATSTIRYVTLKNIFVLLFPFTTKIKSFFKTVQSE